VKQSQDPAAGVLLHGHAYPRDDGWPRNKALQSGSRWVGRQAAGEQGSRWGACLAAGGEWVALLGHLGGC